MVLGGFWSSGTVPILSADKQQSVGQAGQRGRLWSCGAQGWHRSGLKSVGASCRSRAFICATLAGRLRAKSWCSVGSSLIYHAGELSQLDIDQTNFLEQCWCLALKRQPEVSSAMLPQSRGGAPALQSGLPKALTRQHATTSTGSERQSVGGSRVRLLAMNAPAPSHAALRRILWNDRSQQTMVMTKTRECSRESRGPATSRSRTSPRRRSA